MTLKELLKPPFYFEGDSSSGAFFSGILRLFSISDYGDFQNSEHRLEMLNFIVQALNEKWERDFGEPKLMTNFEQFKKEMTVDDFLGMVFEGCDNNNCPAKAYCGTRKGSECKNVLTEWLSQEAKN